MGQLVRLGGEQAEAFGTHRTADVATGPFGHRARWPGVLEAPVMMSFLPRLCQKLLGKELRLPNIATWWCGQKEARQTVLGRMGELAIAGAFGNPVTGVAGPQPLLGAALDGQIHPAQVLLAAFTKPYVRSRTGRDKF